MRKWFVGLMVAGAAFFGAAAPPAHAAGLEFEIEDEGLLLSNPLLAPDAVNSWKKLGVDTVRLHARWWQIAPGASDAKMPAGFNPTNPNDPAVQLARARRGGRTGAQRRHQGDAVGHRPGAAVDVGQPVQEGAALQAQGLGLCGVLAGGGDALQEPRSTAT